MKIAELKKQRRYAWLMILLVLLAALALLLWTKSDSSKQ
jgi:hypothetical protein